MDIRSDYQINKDELVIRFTNGDLSGEEYRRLEEELSKKMEDDLVS
jgi:hypothetical protein